METDDMWKSTCGGPDDAGFDGVSGGRSTGTFTPMAGAWSGGGRVILSDNRRNAFAAGPVMMLAMEAI